MTRRAAVVTQSDIARAIRAARQAGAAAVDVRPDGTVRVHLSPQHTGEHTQQTLAMRREIDL